MTDEHERYERLVVGHVLGDLVAPEDGAFRTHLMGCADCRSRVAELRGIAADLAEIERDEAARARVRTAAPRRADDAEGLDDLAAPAVGARVTVKHVTVAAIVVVVLAAAMGFWNLHLRTTAVTYLSVAESRGDALSGLATGVPLDAELGDEAVGLATSDGDTVSFTLSRIAPLAEGEVLVAWFLDGPDGTTATLLARPGQLEDDTLATRLDDPGAAQLVVSRERGQPGDEPSDDQLLRAELLETG